MQAVILAVGMATRLRPLTDSRPKCLLDVGGKTILERTLENLLACGIDDFVIVTGFKAEMIESFVAREFDALKVSWIRNERYAETNNAYSLLLAEAAAADSFLLLDSDILFPPELIRALMACPEKPCLALDRLLEQYKSHLSAAYMAAANPIRCLIGKYQCAAISGPPKPRAIWKWTLFCTAVLTPAAISSIRST